MSIFRQLFGKLFNNATSETELEFEQISILLSEEKTTPALASIERILAIDAKNVRALQLKAVVMAKLGLMEKSLELFQRAIQISPKDPSLRFDFGNLLRILKRFEEAEVEYRISLSYSPDSLLAIKNLGHVMAEMGRHKEAMDFYERALIEDELDEGLIKRAALSSFFLNDFAKIVDVLQPLYEKNKLETEFLFMYGVSLMNSGNVEASELIIGNGLKESPHDVMWRYAFGFQSLFKGEWLKGFEGYELRHDAVVGNNKEPFLLYIQNATFGIKRWTTEDVYGKRLLIWTEQGLGDVIMMFRYIKHLEAAFKPAQITFLCPLPLMGFQQDFESVEFIQIAPDWVAPLGKFDLHCPIMSLAHVMQVVPEAVRYCVPYLFPLASRSEFFKFQVGQYPGPRIGLVWAGGTKFVLDTIRSLLLTEIKPIVEQFQGTIFSLQKDPEARYELELSKLPIVDLMDHCDDMLDTAGLIAELDLVISVDTSVAHLAGAMGKPVWLMNRFASEWRWGRGKTDSVWYPSMFIMTQKEPGDWQSVVEQVCEKLESTFPDAVNTAPPRVH